MAAAARFDARTSGPVGTMVARARRAVMLARAGEAFLIGVAGSLFTLACAVLSGAEPDRLPAWSAAVIAGLLGGLTWWFEHRPQARTVARTVDARLGQNGAFLTAFESESRAGNPLTGLLGRRVAARIGRRDVARVALPRSMPWIALPFLGAAFLGAVLEVRRDNLEPDLSLQPLLRRISGELDELRPAAFDAARDGSWSADQLERLLQLDARARALSTPSPDRGDAEGAGASAELDSLFGDLEALRVELPASSPLARELERVAIWVDAARMRASSSAGAGTDREPGDGPQTRRSAESRAPGTSGTDPTGFAAERANSPVGTSSSAVLGGTPPGSALAGSGSDGTMSGRSERSPDPALSPTGPSVGEPAPARGLVSGRWWPAHHAGVVERWAEIRRRELERGE